MLSINFFITNYIIKHILLNEVESAAIFYHQVTTGVQDMFSNFYFVKNHKIDSNSATDEAREIISADLKFLEFRTF
jgi:hypothetical protein